MVQIEACPNEVGAGRQASGDRQEDPAASMVSWLQGAFKATGGAQGAIHG